MKYNNLKYIVRFISLFCASFIAVFTIFCQFSISAFAVHSGGGGSLFGGVEGDTFTGAEIKALAEQYKSQYQPMPTATQYTWSYQTTDSYSTSYPYNLCKGAPIYMHTNGSWGKKNWSGVYLLPFLTDDDLDFKSYYSKYYYHFYSTREDGSSTVKLHLDRYFLDTSELFDSWSWDWDVSNQLYLGFDINNSNFNNFYFYYTKLYSDYLGNSNTYTRANAIDLDYFISSDSSTTSKIFPLRRSSTFTPNINNNDDWGFYLSSEPFELFATQTSIDFEQIPDNYTITINGDTIYDYSITNPDTGETSTINEYVTNNYTYITNNNGDSSDNSGSSGSSGTTSGDVNVGGNVSVSGDVSVGGEISIKADPIDINVNTQPIDINVNVSGAGSLGSFEAAGVQFDEDVSLNNYYDWMNEQTSGFSGFMSKFFSWLPPDIVIMLCAGFACVILARFLGR